MAVESSLSQDFTRNNIKDSEPKKKLKKTRSIKLSKVPSLKPSSRRSKSRFNWLSIDLNDSSSLLDFSEVDANYMNVTNSSDAKKNSSQGASEIDDLTSVGSSSNGSSILANLNQTTRIQKMFKNHVVSRSFRRRGKSRTVQPPVAASKDSATSHHPLSVRVGNGSPNYLKATNSSEGRKANSQASSRNLSSLFESSDQSSSHISTPKSVQRSSQTLARTPSMRSVRIQLNKNNLKPKRASFKCSHNSRDLNVDRATCSSTFKDKKFPEQVELSSDGNAAEPKSIVKVCPYQYCSLHGHSRNAAPAPKRSLYKKRRSLKPQINMKPEIKSASLDKFSDDKNQEFFKVIPHLECSSQDTGVHSAVLIPGKKEKDVSFSIEIHAKLRAQFSSKTDEETGESVASEATLGESSCFLETHKENINEMMSSLIKSLSDLKEKSVGCRCKSEIHEHSSSSAWEIFEPGNVAASDIGYVEDEPTTYDQSQDSPVDNLADIPVNIEAQVNEAKFNDVSEKSNPANLFDVTYIGLTEQSKISTVTDHRSTEPRDTSAGKNTSNTLEARLTLGGGLEDNKSIPVEYPESSSHHEGYLPNLSGGKNISMWQLIHQHMISSLASDVEERPPQTENEENQVEETKKYPPIRASADTERQEDENNQSDDTTNKDIELRKVLAIKLVREAIEKILLPEVPDQSSDDQSTTSETTSEQDLSEQIHAEENLNDCKRVNYSSNNTKESSSKNTKESGPAAGSKDEVQQVKTVIKLEDKSEKKAPKHWSNLKKWIILQRFVKALEKVKKINPRGPRYLGLEPEPEGEKVALRHQTTEEKKNAEEWMLDYALRQAISQLAPTQKKKVSLLVKAFETVVPPQEDSDINSTIFKLKETSAKSLISAEKHEDSLLEGNDMKQENLASPLTDQERKSSTENEATNSSVILVDGSQILKSDLRGTISTAPQELVCEGDSDEKNDEAGVSSVEAPAISADPLTSSSKTIVQEGDCKAKNGECRLSQPPSLVEPSSNDSEKKKTNHIKMWHMVYQHVVSSIVEKVGTKLLDGADEEDSEDATELPKFLKTEQYGGLETYATIPRSGFSRREAVKLMQEAVDEILLPEIQDDLSETESVTSDTAAEQELSEKSHLEDTSNRKSGTKFDPKSIMSTVDDTVIQDQQLEILKQNRPNAPKMKNWSKLKKLMLLKRSIIALDNARNSKSQLQNYMQSKADPQPETLDMRRQMMNEKKKAEQWMIDYAV
ncbi:hypothetical protein LIER_12508 [Lithospermum erythrorhizon]|uniref:Calmodulin-binding domain-containing protein n=1 Tax=Lithospermum erythrorhizon TaxID=34254 RepID=A0AAV3PWG3_LITER